MGSVHDIFLEIMIYAKTGTGSDQLKLVNNKTFITDVILHVKREVMHIQ